MTSALARVTVRTRTGASRSREPLTFGMPLPPGRVRDTASLVVHGDAGALDTDATVLERWSDGSVRWVLVDTVTDVPAAGLTLALHDGAAPATAAGLVVESAPTAATIRGPRVVLRVDTADPRLITSCTRDGEPALTCTGRPVTIVDGEGREAALAFTRLIVEHAGRLRAVVRADGVAALASGRRLDVALRFTALAHHAAIGVELCVHNPSPARHDGGFWELGDAGSVDVASVAFRCAAPRPPSRLRVAPGDGTGPFEGSGALRLVQRASGGEAWQSRVHVDRHGVVPLTEPGYALTLGAATHTGRRAAPAIEVVHDGGLVSFGARAFWPLFPKAVDVDAGGAIAVWSLPAAGAVHEIQGGERCDFAFWIGLASPGEADPIAWCREPSTALPDVAAVAAVEHLPALEPAAATADAQYERLLGEAIDGDDTFLAKRERIDEFGWRHFGDLYADHENGPTPGRTIVSHYNNQYDAVLGLTLQALRHDDHRWWQQAADLARHVARIDIYWTTGDRAAYNGGMFWHSAHYTDAGTSTHRTYPRVPSLAGGGPSNEHCYAQGLLLHHLLTGDPLSRAAVVRLGEWVLAIDDGRQARWPLRWLSGADTGGASSTYADDYHGPGRGAANSLLTLLSAWRATGDSRFAEKAESLLRRVIHPDDDLPARRLLDVEGRWSYTVFLQALGRYLWVFESRGRDARWEYARASLLHYARWMADHEYFYLDQPAVLEFPTETWAAQEVRKAEVFDLAAHHATTAAERTCFLERARYFHRRALDTLEASPTRRRTRPLVLLLSNGFARDWCERHTPSAPLHPAAAPAWPPPVAFVPQKAVALRRARLLALGALAAAAAVAAVLVAALA